MKILIVEDSKSWAIHQLSDVIARNNRHHQIRILEIHPKELRANPEIHEERLRYELQSFDPDVVHFQYWDLAGRLHKLCDDRKVILTHHNQKNLLSHDLRSLNRIVVHTQKAKRVLEENGYWNVDVIQHGIDIRHFSYNDEYDTKNRALGYCGRIVPWKGLYEILKVAKELGTKVIMMGKIDKPDYWKKCLEFKEQMDIRFDTPREDQPSVYHEMGVYVGNSIDNLEEGTLPLLEAMSCGVPVVTTASGEAADVISHGENGLVVDFENYESLKRGIQCMLDATDRNKLRSKAWNTVKLMNEQVMARKYEKAYYATAHRNDLVSVIIPTHKRSDKIYEVLEAYATQTYEPIEILLVVDDVTDRDYFPSVDKFMKAYKHIPIRLLCTKNAGYGLAQARNEGIFEASGHYLLFSDDRFAPDHNAVKAFVEKLKSIKKHSAVWGDKGAGKRDFIENFFMIRKKDIAEAGMFNERINEYGGQSQEIRERLRALDYNLQFEPAAFARQIITTHSASSKRYQILNMKTKLWKLKN